MYLICMEKEKGDEQMGFKAQAYSKRSLDG